MNSKNIHKQFIQLQQQHLQKLQKTLNNLNLPTIITEEQYKKSLDFLNEYNQQLNNALVVVEELSQSWNLPKYRTKEQNIMKEVQNKFLPPAILYYMILMQSPNFDFGSDDSYDDVGDGIGCCKDS